MCGESYCKYWARSVEANTSKQRASRALARRPRNSPIITQRGEIPSRLQWDSIRCCTLITNHESLNHDQRDAGDASQFELIVTEETERRKERGNESDTLSRDALRVPGRGKTDLGNRNSNGRRPRRAKGLSYDVIHSQISQTSPLLNLEICASRLSRFGVFSVQYTTSYQV